MWETVIPAAASVLGSALKGAAPAQSHAAGGFLNAPTDHSNWTVNIAGDGLGTATPWGALTIVALGVGLFMAARWSSN